MTSAVTHWHAEHANFSRLLALLESQVAVFHEGGKPNYELMIDIVSYLRHYPDRFHHAREDVAFARLVTRQPDLHGKINRLLQEHRVIAKAGDELLALLNEVADEAIVSRASVEAAAATYLVYYRHHLATEEDEVLPRAAELLTPEDWAAVTAAIPAGRDPLFGDASEERYRELRRLIKLEASGTQTR
jgi:hemerythrin-like domain-containing protein